MRAAAQEFEGILLAQLLKTMRGRLGEDGFLPMSQAERLARDMHDEELGRALARQGGIGLAAMLIESLRGHA